MEPGINTTILNRLGSKARCFTKREKAVTISIDGMSIKAELTYNAKTDTFVGFPDDGKNHKYENNNPLILATEAVVTMVSGITALNKEHWEACDDSKAKSGNKRFKQAIGYILAHHTLGSEGQLCMVKDVINALQNQGLYPLALAMDQCTTNVKMSQEAGASQDNPIVNICGQEMVIMFDSPHLLKNAKSMLTKHNAVFNGTISSFKHIKQLYDIDHSATPRLVPKLKEKFINQAPFLSMNVAQATRTLSNSVATGIEYYVDAEDLPLATLRTAACARFYDNLFDTFNCRNTNNPAKPYRGAITESSCHWSFLEQAKEMLSRMYYTSKDCFDIKKAEEDSKNLTKKQRKPNYLGGFIGNINGIKWLFTKLKEDFDCDFLCSNHLCQDCNENLFSEIRRRCGRNDAPNAYQFAAAFKYAAISASEKVSEGTNCEPDGATPLCVENDLALEDTPAPEARKIFKYKFEQLNEGNNLTPREMNGLAYILGAVVRKLRHKKCIKQLTIIQDETSNDSDSIYRFCHLKNASCYPGSNLFEIGMLAYRAYKQKFTKFLHQNRKNVKTRLKEYLKHDDFKVDVCHECFQTLIDKIFNVLIQCFLRDVKNELLKSNKLKRVQRKGKRNRKAFRMNLPI